METLLREEARLSQEWRETQARLLRLDRQRELLRQRGREMIRRGLKTLDELDEVEERERKEREQAEHEAQLLIPDELADPVAVDGAHFDLSNWLVQNSSFGIAPADGSSSQGSS